FLAEFEHSAAARFFRHEKWLFHGNRGQPGARERRDHHPALVCAILGGGKSLEAAAAADPKMPANAHGFRAASRYSVLPSPPVMGLSISPKSVQPVLATRSAILVTAASWAARSRTTPPLPTAARPTSNCGLTSATSQASRTASDKAG